MRVTMVAILMFALTGCDAVQTAMNQNGDVASGGVEARNQQAQARLDAEHARNESLHDQLADLQSQEGGLQVQLSMEAGRLHQIKLRLAHLASATQEQRMEYKRLLQKQQDLQHRVAAAKSAPPPSNHEDAADQKEDLDKLAQEKADLEKQVDSLQHAL
jgi:molybdopterin-biosynthesis enzyme MoeA-like protein